MSGDSSLIQKTDEWGRPDYSEKWDWNVPEIPTFPETDSGRRRKGELEIMVDYCIKEWLSNSSADYELEIDEQGDCTAEYIAHRCTELDGRPTSSGAVWKILTHFANDLGYADISTKPNEFITLTEIGLQKGLRQLTEEWKRAKKKEKRNQDVRDFNKAVYTQRVRKMR